MPSHLATHHRTLQVKRPPSFAIKGDRVNDFEYTSKFKSNVGDEVTRRPAGMFRSLRVVPSWRPDYQKQPFLDLQPESSNLP